MLSSYLLSSLAGIAAVSALPLKGPSSGTAVASIGADFPDPSIIQVGDSWYSFATNANGVNIQLSSTQNVQGSWSRWAGYDALPTLPAWVSTTRPEVWAPDVVQTDSGFVMYFAASKASNEAVHCLGTATSSTIQGPYAPSPNIFACDEARGGSIDASGFYDPNTQKRFVTYKIDANSLVPGGMCGNGNVPMVSIPIMLQEVASDGITPVGGATQILDRIDADGPLIEAPNLTILNGQYYLFFSSNCFNLPEYDISFAVSNSVYGPFTRGGPFLVTPDLGLTAPGGASISKDGSYIVFHAGAVGARNLYAGKIEQQGGTQIRVCVGEGCQIAS
ncbi:putative glycoside hydrolase family 43 [Venturia nashicola]|uniref:Putative glycoside hydrolase family 43 n=1 Tax=Venturia nashicola TaxID=86259 RepID=A0A4Z1NI42_9PEZI|nr:putative glycoside hydrolase family 43 [Venturia nashicola]TLD21714.1 putative glycoside hydrolase family 43 [Venturia nashicola]